jgi:hypothetical protein
MAEPNVIVVSARVDTTDGRPAAHIDLVDVGGGSQIVTVDGTAEERIHPTKTVFHVRLVSPDRMVPDELRETATYADACALARKYATRLEANADRLAELAADLKV